MKKIFALILTLNLIFSESINLDTALNVAENFFFYKNDSRTSSFSIESTFIHTVDDENIFYVINLNPRGFMLISADNLIRPVLAYSFNENYKNEELPVNIDYLFNLYAKQLTEQKASRTIAEQEILEEWILFSNELEYTPSSRNVGPLLSSRFDQGSAWNDMCPEDPDGPGGNALVG